jgi:hypothetical protein
MLSACLEFKPGDQFPDAGGDVGAPDASPDAGSNNDAASWPPPNPTWAQMPECATSIGSGWITECMLNNQMNYDLAVWTPALKDFTVVPGSFGTSVIADLNGNPWVVSLQRQIYNWGGSTPSFFAFGGNFSALAVASGTSLEETWAIQSPDQSVWNWTGSKWTRIASFAATKLAVFSERTACGDHVPWAIDYPGTVYRYVHGAGCSAGWFEVVAVGLAVDITTDFVVGHDGRVKVWDAGKASFVDYVDAPWGANTTIGGWVNGFFAASTQTHAIQQICQFSKGACP